MQQILCFQVLRSHNSGKLLENLKSLIGQLSAAGLIKLSMDGSHTNWKLFDEFTKDIPDPDTPELMNMGSFGVHIIHGALERIF